jgi:hypothetical protein
MGSWRPVVATDYTLPADAFNTAHQLVGKLYKVEKIDANLLKSDVIQGAPGLGLYGTIDGPIAGVDNHLLTAASLSRLDVDSGISGAVEVYKYSATILFRI